MSILIEKKQFKRVECLLVLLSVILFASCNFESGSNYTPEMRQDRYFVNQHGDTLKMRVVNSELVMDTLEVGDTVSFGFLLNGFTNNLTRLSLNQSADSVSRVLLLPTNSLDSVFTAQSDYPKGVFYFKEKVHYIHFPFKYIARSPSKTAKLGLVLQSDAKFNGSFDASNTYIVELKTPIKAAKIN